MLQQLVRKYQKRINKLENDSEELEQYDRRLCIRIEGVPSAEKETSEEVLEKVKCLV